MKRLLVVVLLLASLVSGSEALAQQFCFPDPWGIWISGDLFFAEYPELTALSGTYGNGGAVQYFDLQLGPRGRLDARGTRATSTAVINELLEVSGPAAATVGGTLHLSWSSFVGSQQFPFEGYFANAQVACGYPYTLIHQRSNSSDPGTGLRSGELTLPLQVTVGTPLRLAIRGVAGGDVHQLMAVGYQITLDPATQTGTGCDEQHPEACVTLTSASGGVWSEIDFDGDGIYNSADNAPLEYNPSQSDSDLDGVPDVVDVCPTLPGTDMTDTDGDGAGDACDCASDDPTLRFVPTDEFAYAVKPTKVEWNPLTTFTAGSATRFDVVRGWLHDLPNGWDAATCLASETGDSYVEDTETLPAGEGVWYLVRPRNACGTASYGTTSSNESRDPQACP
jgi:hypothetical protein